MKKLVLLCLCSLFLVSCTKTSDFLESEKLKHPERFYYHDHNVDNPWFGQNVKVYDEGTRTVYKYVKNVKTEPEFTKIKLSDNNEIIISSKCDVSALECGYCVKLYNGDVICTGVILLEDVYYLRPDTELLEYELIEVGKDFDLVDCLARTGHFSDFCYKSDEDDYKEFYNIKD